MIQHTNLTKTKIIMSKLNYDFYEAPASTVVEVKAEGMVCASGAIPQNYNNPFGESQQEW